MTNMKLNEMVSRSILILLVLAFLKIDLVCVTAKEVVKRSYEAQMLERLIQLEMDVRLMKTDVQKQQNTGKVPLIAFSAYNPADWTPQNGQVVVFKSVYMNTGGGYDTTYGIFTAPVRGLYQFTAHFCNGGDRSIAFGIYIGGIKIAASTVSDADYSGCGSVTALTMMEVRQTVTVRGDYDGNLLYENEHRQSSFIGVLINT